MQELRIGSSKCPTCQAVITKETIAPNFALDRVASASPSSGAGLSKPFVPASMGLTEIDSLIEQLQAKKRALIVVSNLSWTYARTLPRVLTAYRIHALPSVQSTEADDLEICREFLERALEEKREVRRIV